MRQHRPAHRRRPVPPAPGHTAPPDAHRTPGPLDEGSHRALRHLRGPCRTDPPRHLPLGPAAEEMCSGHDGLVLLRGKDYQFPWPDLNQTETELISSIAKLRGP